MSKIKRRNTTDSKKNIINTQDSFTNFNQKLGLGADNTLSGSTYSLNNMISRNHVLLEAAYRGSWLVGAAVDCIAEDMTKEGTSFQSEMAPDDMQKLQVAINKYACWEALADTIKWARLYGGALAVPIIDGADYSKPLNPDAIGKGKFKGILVLDRWMVDPSLGEIVTDLNQDFGKPKYYRIVPAVTGIPLLKIHYTRCFRFDGIKLPYYQKLAENMWGLSIVERMYDRLLAYDSSTTGAAQLLYKAYLRVIGVDGFREALAMGGETENAVIKQFTLMRQMQSLEGITLLDKEDTFDVHQYAFAGISDLLIQFGEQISGAIEIPLVRLFGQSPAGLSSTGESDLRNYYDAINKKQENQLRPHLEKLFKIVCMSELGKELPKDFEFTFNSLWQTSDKENADIATVDSTTIINAHGSGLIKKSTALKELLQQSRVSGRFTNITDEEIEAAEEEEKNPPPNPFDNPDGDIPKIDEEEAKPKEALKAEEGENEVKAAKKSDEQPLAEHKKEEAQRKHETERDSAIINDKISFKDRLDNLYKKVIGDSAFKEEEHPRKKSGSHAGEFTSKSGGSETSPVKQENFKGINFSSSKMENFAEKRKGNLQNINFKEANLYLAYQSNLKLDNSNFKRANIKLDMSSIKSAKKTNFENAIMNLIDDNGEDFLLAIEKGKFDEASFKGVDFSKIFDNNDDFKKFILLAEEKNIDITGITYKGEKVKTKQIETYKATSELRDAIFGRKKSSSIVNKIKVNNELEKETKLDKKYIKNSISEWAITSANESFGAILTQIAAKKIFNLKDATVDHFDNKILSQIKNEGLSSITKEKFVKAQYDLTQKFFKKLGYSSEDKITLYRGITLSKNKATRMRLQPLSSFSFDRDQAEEFGGTILEALVPIKSIFSTPITGFGCTGEEECVILGSKDVKFNIKGLSYDTELEKENSKEEINIDADIVNADWLKTTWDLPPYKSEEFFEVLEQMKMTLEHFKTLPVYKHYIKNIKEEAARRQETEKYSDSAIEAPIDKNFTTANDRVSFKDRLINLYRRITRDTSWNKEGRYSYVIRTSTKKVEVKPNFDFTNKLSSYSILVSDIKGNDLMNTKLYDVRLPLNEAKLEAEKYL